MRIYIYIILTILFGCSAVNSDTEIFLRSKNWYTYLSEYDSINTYKNNNYQEYFFGKQNIFRFDNVHSFLSPLAYKVINDSIFIIYKKDHFVPPKKVDTNEFIGKIKIINSTSFYLINGKDSLLFKEISLFKENLMSNYIKDSNENKIIYKKNIEKYYEFSNKRMNILAEIKH